MAPEATLGVLPFIKDNVRIAFSFDTPHTLIM